MHSPLNNILKYYNLATPDEIDQGLNWYIEANKEAKQLAKKYSHKLFSSVSDLECICGIIAALSPSCKWAQNLIDAENLLQFEDQSVVTTYGPNKTKALRILSGENPDQVLGGNKVRSFYFNILNPHDHRYLTIDRHATRIFYDLDASESTADLANKYLKRKNTYRRISVYYKLGAQILDLTPNQLQAITWLSYKRIQNV